MELMGMVLLDASRARYGARSASARRSSGGLRVRYRLGARRTRCSTAVLAERARNGVGARHAAPRNQSLVCIEVDGVLQASAKTAADRGPALALAIVVDQPVAYRLGVQLVLDVRCSSAPALRSDV